jgi:PAS domain S-box-containing protein
MTRSPAEKALLTYQAMAQSDDVIILMERLDGPPTADALIIGPNDAFRRASGYSDDQLLGRKMTDLFSSGNQSDGFRGAIRNTRSLRAELACLRAGGTTFVLGFHLMPAPARSSGQPFVVLGRDITDILRDRQTQNSHQRHPRPRALKGSNFFTSSPGGRSKPTCSARAVVDRRTAIPLEPVQPFQSRSDTS